MPRSKIMLPEGFELEYLKHPNVEWIAKKYNVSQETVKARLREKGISAGKHNRNRGGLRRDLSKELLEKRKVNTEMNNRFFAKNNIKGKICRSRRLGIASQHGMGYHGV